MLKVLSFLMADEKIQLLCSTQLIYLVSLTAMCHAQFCAQNSIPPQLLLVHPSAWMCHILFMEINSWHSCLRFDSNKSS